MDLSWVSPALVGVIALGNAWAQSRRDARHSGAKDERLNAAEKRLDSHSSQIGDLRDTQAEQGEKISEIRGHLGLA